MAAQPFFDISRIDLSQDAATQEQILAINPHRGDMRHLDRVIWLNDDRTQGLGVKYVRDDEFWVPGHLPGRPLLPGVIMIEAAAQLCSYIQKLAHPVETGFLAFIRCDDAAFRGQVVPGDVLYLLAKEISYRPRRFVSGTQAIVNDRIVFEAKITGMAMEEKPSVAARD